MQRKKQFILQAQTKFGIKCMMKKGQNGFQMRDPKITNGSKIQISPLEEIKSKCKLKK